MTSPRWTPLYASILLVSTAVAAAQSTPNEPRIAVGSDTPVAALQRAPRATPDATPRTIDAATARRLWDDPEIRNFKGLAENSYDFTNPNGVPGFGHLTADGQ